MSKPSMNAEKSSRVTSPGFPGRMESLELPTRGPKADSSEPRWAKMTPMEWIEDLNAKAKAAEGLHGRTTPSKTGTGHVVSTPLPPQSAFATTTTSGEKRVQHEAFATGNFVQAGGWRQSPLPIAGSCLESLLPEIAKLVSDIHPAAMPLFWDLSCLQPSDKVDRIRLLVLAIEGQAKFVDMKHAFEQIRDHFTFSLSQCHASEHFEMLCRETIGRLQSLLVILVNDHQESTTSFDSAQSTPRSSNGNIRSSAGTPNKALFHNHMNNWLRANWINPYPDEAVSHQLAYETGETLHVVNTWLMNARSRRWRPAVLKAFESNRPSALLWEDSIAVFEDKPLRSLDGQNQSSSAAKRLRLK